MLTESQLLERKKGIGGSDASAVCGISKWRTPLDVFSDKTTSEINQSEDNRYKYWGRMLEPVIIDHYKEIKGKQLVSSVFGKSEKHPFMLANIDARIEDGGILECKTADARVAKEWGETDSDFIPDEYLLQCAHYAIVFDAPYVDLAVLIGGNDFRIYTYKRNSDLEDVMVAREKEFWENHVLKNIPPKPITVGDLANIAKTNGNMKTADDAIKKLVEKLKEVEKTIKSYEDQKTALSFTVKQIIGDYDGLLDEYGNPLATWKIQQANRFDTTLFKKLHPDIYSQFTKPSSSRVFRLRRDSNE
jgi:putative phage-type endonuclease